MPSLNPKDYIMLIMAVAIMGMAGNIFFLESDLEDVKLENVKLEEKKEELIEEIGSLKSQRVSLEASILKQNLSIKLLEVDYNKSISDFNNWKSKPLKVKYKTIYKYREVKSNDCNTTKDIVNAVRSIGYDDI